MWGSVGDNQIGIIHSAAMPVKYSYDTVLDNAADNTQVRLVTFGCFVLAEQQLFAKLATMSTAIAPSCWVLPVRKVQLTKALCSLCMSLLYQVLRISLALAYCEQAL